MVKHTHGTWRLLQQFHHPRCNQHRAKICISLEAPWPSSMVEPGPPKPWRLRRLQRGVRPSWGECRSCGYCCWFTNPNRDLPTQIRRWPRKMAELLSYPQQEPKTRPSNGIPQSDLVEHRNPTDFPLYISTVLRALPAIFFRPNPPKHNGTFRNLQPRSPR